MTEVICLHRPAFDALIDEVIKHIDEKFSIHENPWCDCTTAMEILNVKSKTTLQELRDTGAIRFSQPLHKVILYERASLLAYIEKHARNTF